MVDIEVDECLGTHLLTPTAQTLVSHDGIFSLHSCTRWFWCQPLEAAGGTAIFNGSVYGLKMLPTFTVSTFTERLFRGLLMSW